MQEVGSRRLMVRGNLRGVVAAFCLTAILLSGCRRPPVQESVPPLEPVAPPTVTAQWEAERQPSRPSLWARFRAWLGGGRSETDAGVPRP